MRTTLILSLLCSCVLYTGCTVVAKDTRCQWNQHCVYTDAPSPIRTEVIRPSYQEYLGESRVIRKDPAVR